MAFKTYSLTSDKLIAIAKLCVQEQGSIIGVKAEASQGANLLETNSVYRKRFGDDIYTFFRTSGWYYKASYFMDNGYASTAAIEAVREVLVAGKRIFPQYVDEHDCISDIKWAKTGDTYINKNDRSAYVKDKTIIHNVMGSEYTFYEFPGPGTDPFGYTKAAYNYVTSNGGETVSTALDEEDDGKIKIAASIRELYKGCTGDDVKVWQSILGRKTPTGTFDTATLNKTKEYQEKNGLTADGIVGKNTWGYALSHLT